MFQIKEEITMARKPKNLSVYERITDTLSSIESTEQQLAELKSQLQNLYKEKDDLEMRETWKAIKDNGLTIEDVQKLLEKQSKTTNK